VIRCRRPGALVGRTWRWGAPGGPAGRAGSGPRGRECGARARHPAPRGSAPRRCPAADVREAGRPPGRSRVAVIVSSGPPPCRTSAVA